MRASSPCRSSTTRRSPLDYGRTLFEGHGFRLTPASQVVEAFSNPLWTVIGGLHVPLGLDGGAFVQRLGLLCALLSLGAFALWGPWAEGRALRLEDALPAGLACRGDLVRLLVRERDGERPLLAPARPRRRVLAARAAARSRRAHRALARAALPRSPRGALARRGLGARVDRGARARAEGSGETGALARRGVPARRRRLRARAARGVRAAAAEQLLREAALELRRAGLSRQLRPRPRRAARARARGPARGAVRREPGPAGARCSRPRCSRSGSASSPGPAETGCASGGSSARSSPRSGPPRRPASPPCARGFGGRSPAARWPRSGSGLAAIFGVLGARARSPEMKRSPELPARYIGETAAALEPHLEQLGMRRPLIAFPDLGGLGQVRRDAEVIDVAGLGDLALAFHAKNLDAEVDYLISEGPPSYLDVHGPSIRFAPRAELMSRYLPLGSVSPRLGVPPFFFVLRGLSPDDDPRCPGSKGEVLALSARGARRADLRSARGREGERGDRALALRLHLSARGEAAVTRDPPRLGRARARRVRSRGSVDRPIAPALVRGDRLGRRSAPAPARRAAPGRVVPAPEVIARRARV